MRRIGSGVLALAVIVLPLVQSSTATANSIAGGGYSSSYAGESVFTNNAAGETGQMSAIFFNDGNQPWSPGVIGLLVCAADKITCNVPSNASFKSGWYSDTVYATVTSTVAPGQNGFFIYDFKVPVGTPSGTVTTFNGDVGIIATGAELRPEGYFQVNTTPLPTLNLSLSPASPSIAVGSSLQFTLSGAPAGAAATWSVTGGCGAVTSAGVFVATSMNSTSQPCSVTASVSGSTATTSVIVFGPPSQLGCSSNPRSAVANGGGPGGTFVVTVALKDVNGNTAINAASPVVQISNNTPAIGTASANGSVTPSAGVVNITVTTSTLSGDFQISAAAVGLTGCNVIVNTTGPGPSAITASTFIPAAIASDNTSTSTLRVDVQDANGSRNVADNSTIISVRRDTGADVCTITSVITGSSGSAGGATATATVLAGRAEFSVKATSTPGSCTVNASTNSSLVTGSGATLVTQIVGVANRLAVVANDSPHTVGTGGCTSTGPNSDPSCTLVVLEVQDFNGQRLTGDGGRSITATLDPSTCTGAGNNVGVAAAPTTSTGRATFAFQSRGAYASCSVSFSSTGLASASTRMTWNPGAADHLFCDMQPPAIINDAASVAVAGVSARDTFNNITTAYNYSISFSKISGTFTTQVDASPQLMVAGVASFRIRSTTTPGSDTYTAAISSGASLPASTCSLNVKTSLP